MLLQKRAKIEGLGIYLDSGSVLRAAGAGVHRTLDTLSKRMQALADLHSERMLPEGALRGCCDVGSQGTRSGKSGLGAAHAGVSRRWSARSWVQSLGDSSSLAEAFRPDAANFG